MEIAIYDKLNDPLKAIEQLGTFFAKSGMFGIDNTAAGCVLAMACLAERKSPTELLRTYHIIHGRLSKKPMAAYAEFRAKGGRVKWVKTGEDGHEARATFEFDGQTIEAAYTIDQATQAGLVKPGGGWTKNPANMLRARLLSNALGMLCPELFAGADDGIEDSPPAPAPIFKLSGTVPPAESVKDDPEEVAAGLAPVPRGMEEPKEVTVLPPQTMFGREPHQVPVPAAEQLPDDLILQLEKAIGEHAVPALKWLREYRETGKEPWLKPNQGFEHLTPGNARMILAKKERFIQRVLAFANGGAK